MRILVALGAGAAFFVALPSPAPAQSVGEHITNYVVGMNLQHDGSLVVQERITYDFGATPKHGIYRDLVQTESL